VIRALEFRKRLWLSLKTSLVDCSGVTRAPA
jgi:hypothetical protein